MANKRIESFNEFEGQEMPIEESLEAEQPMEPGQVENLETAQMSIQDIGKQRIEGWKQKGRETMGRVGGFFKRFRDRGKELGLKAVYMAAGAPEAVGRTADTVGARAEEASDAIVEGAVSAKESVQERYQAARQVTADKITGTVEAGKVLYQTGVERATAAKDTLKERAGSFKEQVTGEAVDAYYAGVDRFHKTQEWAKDRRDGAMAAYRSKVDSIKAGFEKRRQDRRDRKEQARIESLRQQQQELQTRLQQVEAQLAA